MCDWTWFCRWFDLKIHSEAARCYMGYLIYILQNIIHHGVWCMVGFWHWHIPTFIISDISPQWWDFVMVGICWVTTMTMMFWLTGMSVGHLPRWSSEVQCSSPPLPVWAFHFKAVFKKTHLIMIFSVGLGPPSTSPSGFGLHLSLSIEACPILIFKI